MGNQTARNYQGAFGRFSTLSFALMTVFVASVLVAFVQPTNAAHALDGEETPVVDPTPTSLVFTEKPADKTNLTSLSWQWQLTVAEDDTTSYTGYTYILKTADGTIVDQGAGDTTAVSYTKSDALTGTTYTLTVAVVTDPESSPEETLSVASSTEVNTVPPVITDNGTTWSGNTATPGLEVKPGQQPPVTPTEPTDPAPTSPTQTAPETPPAPTYTYEWATDASPGLVTISDTSVLNPAITFHSDGQAAFTVRVTDAFGNFIEYILNLAYAAPFIPGPTVPLVPDYAPPALKPIAALVRVPPLSNRAAIDATSNSQSADTTGDVKGETIADADVKTKPIVAATPTQGWLLLGIAWYWWLLAVAIVGSATLWFRSYRQHDADDL